MQLTNHVSSLCIVCGQDALHIKPCKTDRARIEHLLQCPVCPNMESVAVRLYMVRTSNYGMIYCLHCCLNFVWDQTITVALLTFLMEGRHISL